MSMWFFPGWFYILTPGASVTQIHKVRATTGLCVRVHTCCVHAVFPNDYSLTSSLICQTKSQPGDIMCKFLVCLLFSVIGKIRTAVGSAQLLMAQKFYQFRELCEENLVGTIPYHCRFPACTTRRTCHQDQSS